MAALAHTIPKENEVLAKAVLNASRELGLTQEELGAVIGVHRTVISRFKRAPNLAPHSKEGELALLIIRIARALFALTGGDSEWVKHFMRTRNKVTGGVPAEQIKQIQGLVAVLQFVDGIRGKV